MAGERLTLYFTALGAPCRAVLLAARALRMSVHLCTLDMHKKREHLSDWFGRINPQRMAPTLTHGDYVLWESRAINKYLAMLQYLKIDALSQVKCHEAWDETKDDAEWPGWRAQQRESEHRDIALQLWPAQPRKQSMVDRLLYFDMGTLYQSMLGYFEPQLMRGLEPDPAALRRMERSLELLECFLEASDYAAGDDLTLADVSLITSVSQLEPYGYKMDPARFEKVWCWQGRVTRELPFYEEVSRKALEASAAWAAFKLRRNQENKADGNH